MKKLDILYEDENILVVNKPSHMLTIRDNSNATTIYEMAREYVKKKHKSNKIFIVHRLDKDTSGVLLFAKKEKIKKELQSNWNDYTIREYIAILEGNLDKNQGIIKQYLHEDKTNMVYVTNNKNDHYAQTEYEVIKKTKKMTVVRVWIKTGKKNQIRVAFSSLGHPIIGDKKYKSTLNSLKRLCLHAYKLKVIIENKEYEFIANVPKEFNHLLKINM